MSFHINKEDDMEYLKAISIRGRMAYVICLFERVLIHYNYDKQEWVKVLEKLWEYTYVEYLDDWMYEFAEYLPDSILEDTLEDFEFITSEEYKCLHKLYSESCRDVHRFIKLIFELGSIDLYSRLVDNSPNSLKKIEEAVELLKANGIDNISIEPFRQYSFKERNGWGEKFDGRSLSIIL